MEQEEDDSFDHLLNWDSHLKLGYSDQVASWNFSTLETNLMLADQLEKDGKEKLLIALVLNKSLPAPLWKRVASRIPKENLIKLLAHQAHVAAMIDVLIEVTGDQCLAFKLVYQWCLSLNLDKTILLSCLNQEAVPPLLKQVAKQLIERQTSS